MNKLERKAELARLYAKLMEVIYLLKEEPSYHKKEAILDLLKILVDIENLDGTTYEQLLLEYKIES